MEHYLHKNIIFTNDYIIINNQKKAYIQPDRTTWDENGEQMKIPKITSDNIKYFRNMKELGFCATTKEFNNNHPYEIYSKFINSKIFNTIKPYSDCVIGINPKYISSNTSPPYSSITKNHCIYSTFYIDYIEKNNIADINVTEIGGGYGNIAKIFKLYFENINWTIIDWKIMNIIQKYYLEKNNIIDVNLCNTDNWKEKINNNTNILIATHSWSEIILNKWDVYLSLLDKVDYLFYSTCLNHHCEYKKLNIISKKMKLEKCLFEPNFCVGHFIFKK